MRLTVIGTGYVGLVVGAGFSDFGNHVICVDIDEQRIAKLQRGDVPIYEPGLAELVARNVERGRLHFATDTVLSVASADVVFIAVGTPSGEDGSADLQHLLAACDSIAAGVRGPSVVVTKSTVPVGTGDAIEALFRARCVHPLAVVSNPEFFKEGDAVNDFLKPARVLIGTDDRRAQELLSILYEPFLRTSNRMIFMSRRSAELTKYAANAMLATRISFMNELSQLADAFGADIESIRLGLGSDPRIGNKFLFPGIGFGGSCFPKDIRALITLASTCDVELALVRAVQQTNERQKHIMCKLVSRHFAGNLAHKRIALWGLSFKPQTDDVRESPALEIARDLVELGARVCAYDPEAMPSARLELGDTIEYAESMYEAAQGADALILATEWRSLRQPDFSRLARVMRGRALFDGRNSWRSELARTQGFSYTGIGRR